MSRCPYCLGGTVDDGECTACDRAVRTRTGVPILADSIERDPRADELRTLAALDVSASLEGIYAAHRAGRLSGAVVDRVFERRPVGWRVLLESALGGRCLVVDPETEAVALAFADVSDSCWVADANPASLEALDAVASATGSTLHPLCATVSELGFPPASFDLIVLRCPPRALDEYLARVRRFLAPDGRLALVINGWPRELGATAPLGLEPAAVDATARLHSRIESALASRPDRVRRRLEANGLRPERSYALLSRGTHENELAIPVGDADARRWLLREFDGVAEMTGVDALSYLTPVLDRSGLLDRSYPRYLHVCEPISANRSPETAASPNAESDRGEGVVVLAGKHRTTVFDLAAGRLDRIRKVPNGRRRAVANRRARDATETAAGVDSIEATVPDALTRCGPFGLERVERPVEGRPLDRVLVAEPAAIDRAIDAAYDWLERLQRGTRSRRERVEPADVADELAAERFGLTDPPRIERPIERPRVLAHGDFFGSNVYLGRSHAGVGARSPGADLAVTGVIDWEWASRDANPLVDGGFFALETAAHLAGDFEAGLDLLARGEGRTARALVDRLAAYGEAIGVDPPALAAYLPIGYVERARRDVALSGRLDVDWPGRARAVWDRHGELTRRLNRVGRPR